MTLLLFIAFIGMIAGAFIIFSISPLEFIDNIIKRFGRKDNSIKARITAVTQKKRAKGIRLLIKETKEILHTTNKSSRFSVLCVTSLTLFISGAFVAIAMTNMFLIPVLAVGFTLLPFWYVLFTANFFKKQLNNELETALSVITASYLRTESIITAV